MKLAILARATVACAVAGVVDTATAEQWRGRAIYQLLTDRFARADGSTTATCNTADGIFCGGSWRGIINQLDYIQDMGFTAIWISPVTANIPDRTAYGYAYHGYWQQDLYSLNPNFGTADDLKALSQALHNRGMYLMVDVVANHFGWNGASDTVDFSKFRPGPLLEVQVMGLSQFDTNQSSDLVPFSPLSTSANFCAFNDAKYFHSYCPISDYNNQTMVEDCWIGDPKVELPDLKTTDQTVIDNYNYWIHELVSNYSIDGLRLDTAKHVGKPFWSSFNAAAGVFCTGEVFAGNSQFTCDYQNYLDSILNLPLYYPIIEFMNSTSGTTASIQNVLGYNKADCKDVSVLGTFTENHDLPRFASYTQDMSLAKNALAITILWDGIPIVYAGQEQHYAGYGDPGNREATWLSGYSRQSELYNLLAAVNQVRNRAFALDSGYATWGINVIYSTSNTLATRKGSDGKQVVSVFTNSGFSSTSYTLNLPNTGWSSGTQVVEVISCVQLTVGSDGTLPVPMEGGVPRVYFPLDQAAGSGICNVSSTATTEATGTAASSKKESRGGIKGSVRGRRRKRTVAIAGAVAAAAGVMG